MDKEGADLAVHLEPLWRSGRQYLPAAAGCFLEANQIVARTAGDAIAFHRPGTMQGGIDGGVPGDVYPVWDAVRDAFQRLLALTADNVYATGDALLRVVDMYAESDLGAKQRLDRSLRDLGHDYSAEPVHRQPPELPS